MKDEFPIKYYQELLTAKGRKEHSAFIVEGLRQVEQFIKSEKLKIKEILSVEPIEFLLKEVPVRYINYSQLQRISDSKNPNGVIAVAEIPKAQKIEEKNLEDGKILLLENVQDPGNVGTLIRNAAAFGFSTVILSAGCADVYSPKVVRSTGGAVCNLKIIPQAEIFDCLNTLKNLRYKLVVADLDGESDFLPKRKDNKVIFALGNEGNGVSKRLKSLADFVFTIPFDDSAIESLNVSSAGAVGMYLLRKKELE